MSLQITSPSFGRGKMQCAHNEELNDLYSLRNIVRVKKIEKGVMGRV